VPRHPAVCRSPPPVNHRSALHRITGWERLLESAERAPGKAATSGSGSPQRTRRTAGGSPLLEERGKGREGNSGHARRAASIGFRCEARPRVRRTNTRDGRTFPFQSLRDKRGRMKTGIPEFRNRRDMTPA
jgi:hypothetical protein